ncbi:SRPBCC family protein [Streptomyces clavifer]|uniref:SRPBCC family protein n=1 Tax=Streptomyces clavifer TaxID=68188 RepID=UPI00364DF814
MKRMPLLDPDSPEEPTTAAPAPQHPLDGLDLTPFTFSRRCWVDAAPDSVYRLISDVSLIETWSPSAAAVRYAPGDGPWAGARFSGRNRRDGREWVTDSEVVRADPGVAFAFVVGGAEDGIVRWGWSLHGQGRGSIVRQSWQPAHRSGSRRHTRGRRSVARPHGRQRGVHTARPGGVDRRPPHAPTPRDPPIRPPGDRPRRRSARPGIGSGANAAAGAGCGRPDHPRPKSLARKPPWRPLQHSHGPRRHCHHWLQNLAETHCNPLPGTSSAA